MSSKTSYIDKDSSRFSATQEDFFSTSSTTLNLVGSFPVVESAHLGKVDYDGRMRAHLIHSVHYSLCVTSTVDNTANGCPSFGISRNSDVQTLRQKTGNNDEIVYEAVYPYSEILIANAAVGSSNDPRFYRFGRKPVMIKPYFLIMNGALVFSSTGNQSANIFVYVEYEPIMLSAREAKRIIMQTTSIGGPIEKRS